VSEYSKTLNAKLVSVHVGTTIAFVKESVGTAQVELDGFVGDKHRSYMRGIYGGEPYPPGTIRRNNRQWSAVSIEELAIISKTMDLTEDLSARILGANLCFSGITDLSQLSKGSKLTFPSGATLIVEEYNPPCHDLSEELSNTLKTNSGDSPGKLAFLKAAKKLRGLVGIVDVAGQINEGDDVKVQVFDSERMLQFLSS
jgi:MOSC domain-containing protein YiiM|tara:strand:- start:7476 stop:8072 length:597 start_codon:yes stop_codon:yes gene_type:complete